MTIIPRNDGRRRVDPRRPESNTLRLQYNLCISFGLTATRVRRNAPVKYLVLSLSLSFCLLLPSSSFLISRVCSRVVAAVPPVFCLLPSTGDIIISHSHPSFFFLLPSLLQLLSTSIPLFHLLPSPCLALMMPISPSRALLLRTLALPAISVRALLVSPSPMTRATLSRSQRPGAPSAMLPSSCTI